MRYRTFLIGAGVAALLSTAYLFLTWERFVTIVGVCPRLFCDFVDYYYPMGEAVFRTRLPVEGFLYSPFMAVLLSIFPHLGLDLSLVMWGLLQVTAVLLYVFFFRRLVPAGSRFLLLLVALLLLSYPVWFNFLSGNTSMYIVVALFGCLLATERHSYVAAAMLLAFAVSFKFYPIIFLVPLAAIRSARLMVSAIISCAAMLVLIPGIVLGGNQTLHFYGALMSAFRESSWVTANPHSQFFPHVVLRLLGSSGVDSPTLLLALSVLSYGIAALSLLVAFLVQRARVSHAGLWSFQIVLLTTPFLLKTSWPIDFVYLPFVQGFLLWQVTERRTVAGVCIGRQGEGCSTTALALIVSSTLLSSVILFNLVGNFAAVGSLGLLFVADLLLLFVIYAAFWPLLRRTHETVSDRS